MRTYRGNHPDIEAQWLQLNYDIHADGCDWSVYEKEQEHSQQWRYYKIVAAEKAPLKANYWFAKNLVTGQIGYNRDMAMMRKTRPSLHVKVEQALADRAAKLKG